jgi:hypothetical protein
MPNFEDILDKPIGEIEKPKPKPAGSYLGVIAGLPKFAKVGQDEMDVVDFQIRLMSAQSDVDQDELAAQPPITEWAPVRHRIFVATEQGVWGLRQFLIHTLGFDEGSGNSIKQSLAETPGKQLIVKLSQRPYVNKQTGQPEISTDVESTAHV